MMTKMAAIPPNDAAQQLRDLLGDLGLRELDLLADEQRDALGDLLDRLREVGLGVSHAAKATKDHGGEEAAGECRADDELRALGGGDR